MYGVNVIHAPTQSLTLKNVNSIGIRQEEYGKCVKNCTSSVKK